MFNLEYILRAETFYALQTPVYYYVKTKGSLVSQGMSLANTVRMKRMVFSYYNDFYKRVLEPEEYEKKRLQIYRFLIDAATDGQVLPAVLPGSWKLGEERGSLCLGAAEREGILAEEYRSRKLLDHFLEAAAFKHKLTLTETRLLLCLSYLREVPDKKELADFAGMSPRGLSLALQKLAVKGMIRVEEQKNSASKGKKADAGTGKWFRVVLLPAAEPVLGDLAEAQNDYDRVQFAGFSQEEQIQFAVLSEKIKGNIQNALVKSIKKV